MGLKWFVNALTISNHYLSIDAKLHNFCVEYLCLRHSPNQPYEFGLLDFLLYAQASRNLVQAFHGTLDLEPFLVLISPMFTIASKIHIDCREILKPQIPVQCTDR